MYLLIYFKSLILDIDLAVCVYPKNPIYCTSYKVVGNIRIQKIIYVWPHGVGKYSSGFSITISVSINHPTLCDRGMLVWLLLEFKQCMNYSIIISRAPRSISGCLKMITSIFLC